MYVWQYISGHAPIIRKYVLGTSAFACKATAQSATRRSWCAKCSPVHSYTDMRLRTYVNKSTLLMSSESKRYTKSERKYKWTNIE